MSVYPVHNTYKDFLAQGKIGASVGIHGATAVSKVSAAALEKRPREALAPATRSTPAWRTDNIDIIYGRDGHGPLWSVEFPAIERFDDGKGRSDVRKGRFDVGNGGSGHVKSRVQEIETHEIKKNGNFT